MRRREFIALICAVSMLPRAARSQHSTKVYRIAIVHPSHPIAELSEASRFRYYRDFFGELRQLGYVEGNNLVIERFSGEGESTTILKSPARSQLAIQTLFSRSAFRLSLRSRGTSTIPIVAMTSDPVGHGIAASIARPGGNITASPSMPVWSFGQNAFSYSGNSFQKYLNSE